MFALFFKQSWGRSMLFAICYPVFALYGLAAYNETFSGLTETTVGSFVGLFLLLVGVVGFVFWIFACSNALIRTFQGIAKPFRAQKKPLD